MISSRRRKKDCRVILNTLPISHYVEKVRWCLDKSGLKYEEEKDIGIFWVMTTGRTVPTLNVPGKDINISNSSDILRYLYGHIKGQDEKKANFLEPTPESVQLEEKLDQLGSHLVHNFFPFIPWLGELKSSSLCTANVDILSILGQLSELGRISPQNLGENCVRNKRDLNFLSVLIFQGLYEYGIPPWQRVLLKVVLPILKKFLITVLKIDKGHAIEDLKKAEVMIEEMDKVLAKNQFLMGGDEPTYIDFAYAALLGIVIFPDQYGGSDLSPESRLKITDGNTDVQKYCKKMRNTPSGKFVLRMYSEHR